MAHFTSPVVFSAGSTGLPATRLPARRAQDDARCALTPTPGRTAPGLPPRAGAESIPICILRRIDRLAGDPLTGAARPVRRQVRAHANPGQYRQRLAHLVRRGIDRSEEHTSELQSPCNLVCRLLLEKK